MGRKRESNTAVINVDYLEAIIAKSGKADAVRHGRWAIDEEDIKWGNALKKIYCTNCGKRPHFDKESRKFILSNYCPNCGAKMIGERKGK